MALLSFPPDVSTGASGSCVLLKKADAPRRRIRELQDALETIMNRLARFQRKPERRKASRKK
jgi:hypothetical protein